MAQNPPSPPAPPAPNVTLKKYNEALEIPSPFDSGPQPNGTDIVLWGLLDRRYWTANSLLNVYVQGFQAGTTQGVVDRLVDGVNRVAESEVAICALVARQKPECYVNAYQRAVKLCECFEEVIESRRKYKAVSQYDLDLIRYERLSMQIKLLEAKKALEAKGKKGDGK